MRLWQRLNKVKITDWLRIGKNATIEIDNSDGTTTSLSTTEIGALNGVATEVAALSGLTATSAELNRVCDASARIVTTTATALSLTLTEHGERLVLVNTNSTVANTFTLPAATGSGAKFTIKNNVVQTQGTVVFAANGTDVFAGYCVAIDTTGGNAIEHFATSATSDKMTLNLTTTGGLGGDILEAWDISANTWHVQATIMGSGSLATPFSAT